MKIIVRTDAALKEEVLSQGLATSAEVEWRSDWAAPDLADAYIDLLFEPSVTASLADRPGIVIVNAVNATLESLPKNFIRINGWNTFLQRPLLEATASGSQYTALAENVFGQFNKTVEWVKDVRGFIAPRVVSMIINEAFFALQEAVSTKDEIDLAMKLGTNYPYGPFEWADKIGLPKVYDLLSSLAKEAEYYQPCPLMQKIASLQ